ncbi:hypothetical protein RhiirA4_477970 [Rhizophagus irregularis]|uniref:Uncharacterized protein n=1 Tax=Rhizophagus irregularis TaxID=588596 RepID=A0A2I1HE07_9GLOM|nr:hypothetical protein RhiirA4_477970 [Rhizophagus irregularis]
MSQLPFNEKTLTKRVYPSGFYKPRSQRKKTCLASQLILPKNPLTELQQQNTPQFSSQQHQQEVIQPLQSLQQQNIHPQLRQQDVFSQILPQGQYVHQQYENNPQLYGLLPPISPELEEIQDETSFAKRKDNCEQGQDLNEKSGGWEINEIKILLDYLKENFSFWFKGNKTKFYNNIAKSILPNKEANAIKGKLSHLIKKYEKIKKHNNQSSIDRKDWCWYDQLDEIFGTRENITPSFLANKFISIIDEEETEIKKERHKKQKKKLEKNHELERERIEAEKERWAYEKEKAITERERAKMEFELRMKELELRYQKKNWCF